MPASIRSSVMDHIAKAQFNSQLKLLFGDSAYLTEADYQNIVKLVKEAKYKEYKTAVDLRHLERFDIVNLGSETKLVEPISAKRGTFRYYIKIGDLFDILHETHSRLGHGGVTKMCEDLKLRFVNISEEAVIVYLKTCVLCTDKQNMNKRFNMPPRNPQKNWYRVDLIDMLLMPDGEYNYILVYQDCSTHFVHLCPLTSDRPAEIAGHLLDIFCICGVPVAIYSNLGSIFTMMLLQELKLRWSTLNIVDGKPDTRDPYKVQEVDAAGKGSDDYIRKMLLKWMQKHKTRKWSEGIRHVQLMKNRAFHTILRMSPYQATYGYDPKVGMSVSGRDLMPCMPYEISPPRNATNVPSDALCCKCNSHCSESQNCSICYGVVVFTCTKKPTGVMVVCDECVKCGINYNDAATPESPSAVAANKELYSAAAGAPPPLGPPSSAAATERSSSAAVPMDQYSASQNIPAITQALPATASPATENCQTSRNDTPVDDDSFFDPSGMLDVVLSVGNEDYRS